MAKGRSYWADWRRHGDRLGAAVGHARCLAADGSTGHGGGRHVGGGLLIAFVGLLRHWRGVNETISSLLMVYIALGVFNYLVEGPMKDPASANKPSTFEIAEKYWVGKLLPRNAEQSSEGEPTPRPKYLRRRVPKTRAACGTM